MRLIILFLIAISFPLLVGPAYAQQTARSNPVNTKVGNPSGPAPGQLSNTTTGPIGFSVSCPLSKDGTGSFRYICGTAQHFVNGCGHGAPYPAYPICQAPPYATCPYSSQLRAAVDIRPQLGNGNRTAVYLPYLNGQSVDWKIFSGPIEINGGSWGEKMLYSGSFEGKQITLDFTHLNQGVNIAANRSGDRVGEVKPGFDTDGGGHLHVAMAVNGVWVDAIDDANICNN